MSLMHWFRQRPRPTPTFRPSVTLLEDRTVPSYFPIGPFSSFAPTSGPATHLQVIVPEKVQANQPFSVIVEALDASNQPASTYTGSISFSSNDPGVPMVSASYGSPLAALSGFSYTFTTGDQGIHRFRFELTTTNPTTIAATGTSITPTDTVTTNAATQTATTVVVETPEQAAAGTPTRVEVEILDQAGQVMRDFTGAVTVSSSDMMATGTAKHHTAPATVPITYTFTAWDRGEHTFLLNFSSVTAETATTVTAAIGSSVSGTPNGSVSLNVFPQNQVTHLGVFALPFATTGTAVPVLVVALNASNQVVTSGFSDTISFTSSDTTATVSATKGGTGTALSSFTYPFTSTDNGSHLFWLTFGTTNKQTLTVNDGALSTTADVYVTAPPPPRRFWWW